MLIPGLRTGLRSTCLEGNANATAAKTSCTSITVLEVLTDMGIHFWMIAPITAASANVAIAGQSIVFKPIEYKKRKRLQTRVKIKGKGCLITGVHRSCKYG